jgi:predicted RND superfamily exporter protein
MSRRRRIEAAFKSWGYQVVRHRWLVILVCTALSAVLVSKLPEMRVDNSDEAFLHADDPTRVQYMDFQDQFDREDRVNVILRPARVFDMAFLEKLRALHAHIERDVPYIEEVTSLVNARNTRGEGDELIVEDLMENWPETPAELAAIRERALANPLYIDTLITADESHTVISLKPFTYSTKIKSDGLGGFEDESGVERQTLYLTDVEGYELVDALDAVIARHELSDVEVHVVGGPTFDYQMAKMLQRDVSLFMGLAIGVILVLLYIVFRRASGVLLPTLVVVSSMASSMGFMVWLDIPFSVTLNMLPAFLLVVGICDSIHILTIVYQRLAAGASKPDAIAEALGHSGLAVVMTSITTAAGLASFSIASLLPVAQLGMLAPAGVLLAMVYSLTLLPALLAAFPLRSGDKVRGVSLRRALGRLLARAGDLSTTHPRRVVAASVVVILVALPGVFQVRFSHDGMRWFPDHDPLKMALGVMDREFKGASGLEVLVRTGQENGLYDPAVLQNIQRAMDHSVTLSIDGRPIPKATSIVDVVRSTRSPPNAGSSPRSCCSSRTADPTTWKT